MDDLLAARSQMALSLGFHIIFACIGMIMPFFMAISHYIYLKTGKEAYKKLTVAWSKGVAIFFVTGAVSGTMLSFELGLLWPKFMEEAGPIFGMPFSLEGTAFFIEAIALGFFLYGWGKFHPWFHWFTGVVVGVSGLASGILVVAANAWMNAPTGFDIIDGVYTNIDPIAAMFNEAWFSQALHMTLAAFVATGFAVGGIHAWMIRKGKSKDIHIPALRISLTIGAVAAILMPLSGHHAAKDVAHRQPAKLAAMEAHFHTEERAALIIGGIPDEATQTVNYAIKIPGGLSYLIHGDFVTEVKGLEDIPQDERPPVAITHYGFQIMVGIGMLLMLVGLIWLFGLWKKSSYLHAPWFLALLALLSPLGFIAVEAGWVVTEVGRQPWILYGIMRTADAVTPMPGIVYSFWLYVAVYLSLSLIVGALLAKQVKALDKETEQLSPKTS
ncbi:cytochrome ubiquinol oxidase subunit I [Aquiflexum gelatinilyticum]|uniref:cytochrome ubiquinol oxidase subunit I n=1 Tax=Aquiflexum gelatinilyticum TaxID=2961943 RepID=UPI002169C967|nr:cytochrome ubiquinol oxidase subunit I [Aquiflexum gelatinilyticum]MCS4435802.1 cytochrome ubiquinol oxidase subunit I [Aquiflexum gelatinilyticum]